MTGSSKAMEASEVLDLIMGLHENNFGIKYLVSDDNSTMRARLSHIGTHKHGKLSIDIPICIFVWPFSPNKSYAEGCFIYGTKK